MNNIAYESVTEATGNYLVYNVPAGSEFDTIAVKMLSSDLPYFLAPVRITNQFGERIVKYEVGNYRGVTSIKMRMTKKECCTLIYNMLEPLMDCNEWLLDYHKLCFLKDYILCDTETLEIRYIYILECAYSHTDEEIMNVFRDIFRSTDIVDDKDFRINLLQSLLDENFSINSLYEMISDARKNNKPVVKVPPIKPPKAKLAKAEDIEASNMAAEPVKKETVKEKTNILPPVSEKKISAVLNDDEDNDDLENLFGSRKKPAKAAKAVKEKPKQPKGDLFGNLFGKVKSGKNIAKTEIPDTESENDHTVMEGVPSDYDSDETQIANAYLDLESSEFQNCPHSIPLSFYDKDTVTIGRKSSNAGTVNADFEFPSECSKISRKHCNIRFENGTYSICDLNSGNGTFVNGKRLTPGEWIDIQDGNVIMLGNNAAVFSLHLNG